MENWKCRRQKLVLCPDQLPLIVSEEATDQPGGFRQSEATTKDCSLVSLSPMIDFTLPHCPDKWSKGSALERVGGESSQASAKLCNRRPAKLSQGSQGSQGSHTSRTKWANSVEFVPLHTLLLSLNEWQVDGPAHWTFARRQSKQNYLPASIPSVTGRQTWW